MIRFFRTIRQNLLAQNRFTRYHWDYLYPQVLEHIDVELLWRSAKPVDQQKLATDRKFKEVIKMNLMWRHYMQNQYSEVRELIIALNQQIDQHLNQLNHDE